MKALKNYKLAVVLTVAVCLLSLLFGVHRTMSAEARKISEAFQNGTDGSGYGIAGDLKDRADYADYLVKIAEKYDGLSEQSAAVTKAVSALNAATGAAEKYDQNEALTAAVTALDLALQDAPLSDKDEKYRSEYTALISSCSDTISHEAPSYNALVRTYETRLGGFPVSLLRPAAFLPVVEEFA